MSQKQNRKTPSTHGRPSKPALHRRGHSSNHVQHSSSKPGSSSKKTGSDVADRNDEPPDEGGMGFPQFCTSCDKQIVTPDSSILYCSEACRRKDAARRVSIQTALSPLGNISTATSYFEQPEPDIVPQRSPTMLRPASFIFPDGSVSVPSSPTQGSQEPYGRRDSEAARFLAQFHSQSYAEERPRSHRPRVNRASTGTGIDGIPSLSHTPSSSLGTVASLDRPLPRRHDPSTGHFPSKSVDLVMPSFSNYSHVLSDASLESSVSTLTGNEPGQVSYQKRLPNSVESDHSGSGLKNLFNHSAMQAPPKHH